MKIAIFHGNEKWVLRGLAIDIEKAMIKVGIKVKRCEVDLVNPGPPPAANFYLFVQQGQLASIHKAWGYKKDLLGKSICIFTHFDYKNCHFELLSNIRLVTHMSSHQMAISIGNGLSRKNSVMIPLGVDLDRHFPIQQEYLSRKLNLEYKNIAITKKRSYIGFCTRFWNKDTYVKRKDYQCLLEVVQKLIKEGQRILIIGDGWQNSPLQSNDNLVVLNPPYEHYNYFYNLMSTFVSVTSYDGGPIPLLESLACGVPPIITNSGFAPDIIKNENIGTLFQPFTDANTILKTIRINKDKQYNREMLRMLASQYSFDNYVLKLTNYLGLHLASP